MSRSASRRVRLRPVVGEDTHAIVRRRLHRDLEVRAVGRWNIVAQPGHLLGDDLAFGVQAVDERSEEHTSELQSLAYLVCRLLLEKKKKTRMYESYEH